MWEWLIQGLRDFIHICGCLSTGASEDAQNTEATDLGDAA